MDLEAWLRSLGLERYVPIFRSHDIDVDALLDLTEADFKELGVSPGHRKRLRRAIVAEVTPADGRAALEVGMAAESQFELASQSTCPWTLRRIGRVTLA